MRQIQAILIDDQLDALDLLEFFLKQTKMIEVVKKETNSLTAESIIAEIRPDVVFLDINMPGIDGLQLAEKLRMYHKNMIIIFVTASDIHLLKAIKHHAFDYLLKPLNRKEVFDTVEKLSRYLKDSKENSTKKVKLPIKDGFIYINYEDILYLEAEGNYTHINLINNDTYLSSYNMGRLARKINFNEFERVNRNLIVNTNYLCKVNKVNCTCTLKTKESELELKVSNTFLKKMNRIL